MNKIQVGKEEKDMNTKGETKTSTKLLSPPHTVLESSTQGLLWGLGSPTGDHSHCLLQGPTSICVIGLVKRVLECVTPSST